MDNSNRETAFNKGAVEQDRPEQSTNTAPLDAQLDHRYQDPLNKSHDSDVPEPGQNPEFTGESQGRNELDQDTNAKLPKRVEQELDRDRNASSRTDTDQNGQNFDSRSESDENRPDLSRRDRDEQGNPEGVTQNQDPGMRQKENQNKKKDDPLAA